MKKRMAAVLAALMMLSCATTVFAAPSATASDVADGVKVVSKAGYEVVVEEVTAKVTNSATKAAAKVNKDADVIAVFEVEVPKAKGKVTLTFEVAGIKASDNIVVLHYNGKKWETIDPDKVEKGKITATFTSLSPIAIVELPAENAKADGGEKSPATGMPVVLPFVACICAAGAVGCARKVKFN